jgi:type IV secretion system protein VirD4
VSESLRAQGHEVKEVWANDVLGRVVQGFQPDAVVYMDSLPEMVKHTDVLKGVIKRSRVVLVAGKESGLVPYAAALGVRDFVFHPATPEAVASRLLSPATPVEAAEMVASIGRAVEPQSSDQAGGKTAGCQVVLCLVGDQIRGTTIVTAVRQVMDDLEGREVRVFDLDGRFAAQEGASDETGLWLFAHKEKLVLAQRLAPDAELELLRESLAPGAAVIVAPADRRDLKAVAGAVVELEASFWQTKLRLRRVRSFSVPWPRVFAAAAMGAGTALLAWRAPVLCALLVVSALTWLVNRNQAAGVIQRMGMVLLPLVLGFSLAWAASAVVVAGQEVVFRWKGGEIPPSPPEWRTWIGALPAETRVDQVGRWALLAGAGAGLLLAWRIRPRPRHGPGVVAGKRTAEGGWADPAHLADKCDFGPPREGDGGVPLGRLQGQIVRLNPNKGKMKIAGHTFVVGATGTGKSWTFSRNQIMAAVCDGHSIVVTDPKGELFESMALWLRGKGYELYGFNVANPQRTHRWNPIAECRDYNEIMDLTSWLISAAGDDHAFFSGGEKNVFAAAAAYARWVLPTDQQHLRAALSLLSWPQEALDGAYTRAFREKKVEQAAYETWKAAQGHFSNYVEGVRNKVREMTKGPLAALTAESDFNLADLGRKKTALFLILPEEGDLRSLYVPFYAFMFRRLKEAAEITGNGRLPVPVRFILDEFANIGKIPDIDKVCALGRSRGITVQIAVQNVGQLKGLYSKGRAWEAVIGNCPVRMCLAVDDEASAALFASSAGRARVWDTSESRDVSKPWSGLETRRRESTKDVPIIQPWEIMQMPEEDSIVLLRGKRPIYLQKLAWTDLPQHREILAAGQVRPDELLPEISLEVSLPPYPEAEETPKDRDRSRGGAKVVTKAPSPSPPTPEDDDYDPDAAKKLGIG